jgi:hypothetical protein
VVHSYVAIDCSKLAMDRGVSMTAFACSNASVVRQDAQATD